MPKILSNTPIGVDYLQSGSHAMIAETIVGIIENDIKASVNDKLNKKIIGLEGDWGSGKSNIIKILESKIAEKKLNYYHFLYDTWTHQEDINRKSLLDELISLLKNKNKITERNEIEKYSKLYQKEIKKNTKSKPLYKSYYLLWAFSFLIITFGNIIYREQVNERLFRGFYDDSLRYLIDNFFFNPLAIIFPDFGSVNHVYLLKIIPFLLIFIGILKFLKDLLFLLNQNKSLIEIFSELFSFSKGDSNDNLSVEYIQEVETNNRAFKSFLKNEIDCLFDNEILIITFDNVDRLSDDKVKSIWSMINIFFAEDNDLTKNLKNIWLIVPYDESKIIEAFDNKNEIAKSLLDKTFSFTFRVPPPLTSNWEINIFENLFNQAFNDVRIDENEINLLTRILGEYSQKINPRKIINFINDLVTYYHLNNLIKLRYVALFNLNKSKILSEGSINANIISREYLGGLNSYFEMDDALDINIAKIVYGVKTDEEAYECLLLKDINNILFNLSENKITDYLKVPSFNKYFTKVFNDYVWKVSKENIDIIRISNILLDIEIENLKESEQHFFYQCWDNLGIQIYNQPGLLLDVFVENNNLFPKLKNNKSLLENIVIYSTVKKIKELLNKVIAHLYKNSIEANDKFEPHEYCEFLFYVKESLVKHSKIRISDLKLDVRIIETKLFLEVYKKFIDLSDLKLELENKDLNSFFKGVYELRDDFSYDKFTENTSLLKSLIKDKKYDFSELTEFLIDRVNSGSGQNVDKFNLFIEVIDLLSSKALMNLNIRNSYKIYVEFFQEEKNKANVDLYAILISNFSRYYSLTNTESVVAQYVDLLGENSFDIKEISHKLLKYISVSELIRIPTFFKRIKLNSLNLIIQFVLETNELNDEDFKWVLQNFKNFSESVYSENVQKLLDLFKKSYPKFNFDVEQVDVELVGLNSVYNKKLIGESKKYLLLNHHDLEKNLKTETYYKRILDKLISIDIIDETYFNDDFYLSYKNILLHSNLNNENLSIILRLKRYLNKNDLIKIYKEVLGKVNINIYSLKIIQFLHPEINTFIDEPEFLNKKEIVSKIKRRLSLN